MKVHLMQIPAEGLQLEGKEETDILELDDEQIRPLDTVSYSLHVGVSGSGLFATGRLSVNVELECVNCLKRFVYPLVADDFAIQIELTGAEQVDLTPWIREDILLVLPAHPRCDWDRQTVCAGLLLKNVSPVEEPAASNAWDVLNELKLDRKS